MKITGIICEYNPFHLGHKKQIDHIRRINDDRSGIVCLMSGNFVQRGAPAIIDKMYRAKAAVLCGADLVLELPVTCALSSAEGFAAGGVQILSGFCDSLCFGAESADAEKLLSIAKTLLSDDFRQILKQNLEQGVSFPAAREAALAEMGQEAYLLKTPNNILAVEYCKAILARNAPMEPMPIFRQGSYHDELPDSENPSATAIRTLMTGDAWKNYVPKAAVDCFKNAPLHTLAAGERAVLMRLRTMTDLDFEALPYGSEGLWRKFMHASRREAAVEAILAAVKSKRYTRSRLDRMLMCAVLGITEADLTQPIPYVRALAFNDRGREILKQARNHIPVLNIGQPTDDPYAALEQRCDDLYGLFCSAAPEAPGANAAYRVYYHP